MQDARYTIPSLGLGHIGGTGFTLIVNAPEVSILSTIQPVWDGKAFQPKLMLSLSYDHRVINGAAARFTKRLNGVLADIRTMLL